MALIFTVCVFLFVGPLKVLSADKFYIYEWPQFINRYANFTDRPQHSHGVEFPLWTGHYGAGRLLSKTDMEYKTSQFGLFKIMYERALIDPRRTLNPNEATSFLIPYDFGMDATFFEAHGRMRKTSCPLATEVRTLLEKSIYFKRHKGHDHTMIVSVNQNMNYFFHAQPCLDILMSCWNCTKISIDEYIFIGRDRNYELKNRGINWHAVPYPSDYHYDDTLIAESDNRNTSDSVAVTIEPGDNRAEKKWRTWFKRFSSTTVGQKSEEDTHKHVSHISPLNAPYIVASNDTLAPWERVEENRSIVVSFLGNPRKFSKTATWIREALAQQCGNHTAECLHGSYKHEASGTGKAHAAALSHSSNLESRHSVFCLQPPGDIPTRKIVFDSILSGCIPVLFHPLTAKYMYEWHFTQAMWDDIAVHFDSAEDNLDLITHKTDFIAKLIDMYRHNQKEIARKRQLIRELAFSLQYSLVYLNSNTNTAQVSVLRNKRNFTSQGNLRGSSDRMLYDAHRHIGEFDAYDVTMSRILAIHSGRETHNRTSDYLLCAQIPGGEKIKLQTSDYCNSTHSAIDPFFPPSVQSPLYKGQ